MTRAIITRMHELTPAAALAALILGVAACGSSAKTSAPTSPAIAATPGDSGQSPTQPSKRPPNAKLGGQICDVIRKIQTDLGTGALDSAYGAQFALRFSATLVSSEDIQEFQATGDALAKAKCPTEYSTFLKQAKISSLREI